MTEQDDYLQVFMIHEVVIERFKEWVASNDWVLSPVPHDEGEMITHIIAPSPETWNRFVGG